MYVRDHLHDEWKTYLWYFVCHWKPDVTFRICKVSAASSLFLFGGAEE